MRQGPRLFADGSDLLSAEYVYIYIYIYTHTYTYVIHIYYIRVQALTTESPERPSYRERPPQNYSNNACSKKSWVEKFEDDRCIVHVYSVKIEYSIMNKHLYDRSSYLYTASLCPGEVRPQE